jgi:hypothetical protein
VWPRGPLQRSPDAQGSGFEVDVLPLQPERLALAQTHQQRELPSDPVATACRRFQDRTGLCKRQRVDLSGIGPIRACQHGWVLVQPATADRFRETGAKGAVRGLDGLGR